MEENTHIPNRPGNAAQSAPLPPDEEEKEPCPIEKYRLEREERERKYEKKHLQRRAELAHLCEELDAALTNPTPDAPVLTRQSAILDKMLIAIMRNNLKKDIESASFNEDRLNMALRIQKQCMDTIKTCAAIEYMQFIAATSGNPPLPHAATTTPLPLENGERNE